MATLSSKSPLFLMQTFNLHKIVLQFFFLWYMNCWYELVWHNKSGGVDFPCILPHDQRNKNVEMMNDQTGFWWIVSKWLNLKSYLIVVQVFFAICGDSVPKKTNICKYHNQKFRPNLKYFLVTCSLPMSSGTHIVETKNNIATCTVF